MLDLDYFADFEVPCGTLGTLKPLTLAQMVDMRFNIREDLMNMTRPGLSGEELVKAAAGTSAHVASMRLVDQAQAIAYSPMLLAQAAAMMLGQKWAAMQAANKIGREHIPAIRRAVYQSYGVMFVEEPEEKEPDPPMAATSSES